MMARTVFFKRSFQQVSLQDRSLDSFEVLNVSKCALTLEQNFDFVNVIDDPYPSILDLPDEVLSIIFSFCSVNELLLDLSRVCTRFYNLILHDLSIWKSSYFTCDMNCDVNTLYYIVSKAPAIHCVCFRHPGGLKESSVLKVLKYIVSYHNSLYALQLECHEPASGYSESFVKGLLEGCGNTLQCLRVQGNLLQTAMSSLMQFSVICTLELSDAYGFTGSDLRNVSERCTSLKWLIIPKASYIRDGDLSYFIEKTHSRLLGLDLSGYMLSDDSLAKLSNASQLVHLSVRDARNLEWRTFSALRMIKKLRFIRLRRLRVPGLAVTSWLVGSSNLNLLQFLDLKDSYFLDDHVPLIIAFLCPNLQDLHMGDIFTKNEQLCARVRRNLPKLLMFS